MLTFTTSLDPTRTPDLTRVWQDGWAPLLLAKDAYWLHPDQSCAAAAAVALVLKTHVLCRKYGNAQEQCRWAHGLEN